MRKKKEDDKLIKRGGETVATPAASKATSLTEFPKYDKNPFLNNALLDGIQTRYKTIKALEDEVSFNTTTGEVGGALAVSTTKQVDPEAFVKIYTGEISHLFSLTKSTTNVFYIILSEMQGRKNEDTITINHTLANHWIVKNIPDGKEISKPTFYRAIADLCRGDFIAPHAMSREMFWVNPRRVFNGDRIILARQFIIERNKEEGVSIDEKNPPKGLPSGKSQEQQM